MKLVYKNIERTLDKYRDKNKLDSKAISLLFKGGNVLRLVANGVFNLLPKSASSLLEEQYAPDFKRSDADFTIYIDDKKLGKLDYERVYNEVTELVFAELNNIRKEFKANPKKYFNLLRLKPEAAQKKLEKYFDQLGELSIVKDKSNDRWFNTKFKQIQLLDDRAQPHPRCKFFGQFDYRFIDKDGKIMGIPMSDTPNWIVNTDNRTLEWPIDNKRNKFIKFGLVRSKVAFEYTYEDKDGKIHRKPIGGELIDVSIPHRKDAMLREFLDNYDHNVAEYILDNPDMNEKFTMKAYSVTNLAEDLQTILFSQFPRPWKGGPKYGKRLNRLLFLSLVRMLNKYGMGSSHAQNYVKEIKDKILKPLDGLYPLGANSKDLVAIVKNNVNNLIKKWPAMDIGNNLWIAVANFVDNLVANPEETDPEEFKGFLESLNQNMDTAEKLSLMKGKKINVEDVYNTDINKLF